jgi:protein-S-isoprenylcysteine O-methyltransferase Ste14
VRAAFWAIVLLGLAPYYDIFRRHVSWPHEVAAIRRDRVVQIRVAETAVGLVFLAVRVFAGYDFPLTPSAAGAAWAGLAAALAGAVLAAWGKIHLRHGFTVSLAVRRGHRLITTGPYAWVRHPIYTGLLLLMLGGSLVYNSAVTLLLLMLPFGGFFYWQSVVEEELLVQHFGEAYRRYQATVGRLIPRLSG